MERQVVGVLRDDHVRQEALGRERLLDRLGRRRRLDDSLVADRAGVLEAGGLADAETGRDVVQLLAVDRADDRLASPAPAGLLGLVDVDRDDLARQMSGQDLPSVGTPADVAAYRRLARVHLDWFGDRPRLVGELLEREAELAGIDPVGLLAEQAPTEDIELVPELGVLALGLHQLGLERRDQGARLGEIEEVARLRCHAGKIANPGLSYKSQNCKCAFTRCSRGRTTGACARESGRRQTAARAGRGS